MPDKPWDAVIVGAGPAGSVSAALLARRGWRVLLLERSPWPRDKVCGGCVNAAALVLLKDAGLHRAVHAAHPLGKFALNVCKKKLRLSLPHGIAIPRQTLDTALVDESVSRGAIFAPATAATLLPADPALPFRTLRIVHQGESTTVQAHLVLACDGIAGTLLEHEPWARWHIAADSWIGLAATLDHSPQLAPPGTIGMFVGPGGYAGTVRYADGRVHLAAAVSAEACRSAGGPAPLVTRILDACGMDDPSEIAEARFHGTGLMTRRRTALGGHRVLALGDACGYVEPFTGEGISWAIRGATEVARLLPPSAVDWSPALPLLWAKRHRATIGRRQRFCSLLRAALHRPALARAGVLAAAAFPSISSSVARQIGRQSFSGLPLAQGVGE